MQKEELSFQENEYEFNCISNESNLYQFKTVSGIRYQVQFKSSPYILGNEVIFASHIYELVLSVIESSNERFNPDKRIPFTIVSIIINFYQANDNNVCIYVCDSSDKRQLARAKKFNDWFRYFNPGGFIQLTDSLKDEKGIEYPIGMILKIKNSFKTQIIEAFENLVSAYDKE